MAAPIEDVNQYALEGGDTEPETAAAIKARNEALEAHVGRLAETDKKLAAAREEHAESHAQLEADLAEQTPELVARDQTMEALVTGVSRPAAPAKKSSKASSE